ncbi:redoxin family protein [bacterium]|nr:redoxin family protein [bacterium]
MLPRCRTTIARLHPAGVAVGVILSLVGCTGNRFQLANRDDTPYARDLAANDVRIPVNGRSEDSGLAGGPRVPFDRNDQERFAANVPADPSYPDGPLGPSSAVPPPLPLAGQAPALPLNPGGTPFEPFAAPSSAGVVASVSDIAGRVVSDRGLAAPRVTVQVTDPSQPGRVLAEGATDENGLFRLRQLPAGTLLEVSAVSVLPDGRYAGAVTTRVPDDRIVLQLQPENFLSGRSPLGNRLSTSPAGIDLPRTAPAAPVSLSSTPLGAGSVNVSTVQPIGSGVAAPIFAATGQPMGRVLPPAPKERSTSPASSTNNIDWDAPASARPASTSLPESPTVSMPADKPAPKGGLPLDLPADNDLKLPGSSDLKLDDFSSPSSSAASGPIGTTASPLAGVKAMPASSGSVRPKLAFGGTGLEYARVYDLDGKKQPVGALAGDLILLDFFGSWCGPCRRAIPALNELHDRYAAMGLHIVGVACEYGQTSAALKSADDAVRQFSIRYPVVVSPMEEPSELRDHFQVSAYPTVVLVDRAGKVYFKGEGGDPQSLRSLDAAIQRALSGGRVASR